MTTISELPESTVFDGRLDILAGARSEHSVTIEDRSCDLVIMNPPFTRPRIVRRGHHLSHQRLERF